MAPALYLAAQHIRADPCRAGLGSCSPAKLPGRCSWNKAAAPSRPQRYHVRGGKTLVNRLRYILTPPLPHARRGLFIPFHPKEGLKPVCISDGASPAGGHPGLRAPKSPSGTGLPPSAPGSGQLPCSLPSPGPFSAFPVPHKGSGRPGGGGRAEWPPPPPLREKKGLRQPQRWRSEGEKSPPHPRTRCAQHGQGAPRNPRWGWGQAGSTHPTPTPPRPSPRGWPCPGAQRSEARASSSRHPLLPTIILIITPPPGGTACRPPRRAARLIAAPLPTAAPGPPRTRTHAHPRPPPSERPGWGGPRGAPEKPQKGAVRCHPHPRLRGALLSLLRCVAVQPCLCTGGLVPGPTWTRKPAVGIPQDRFYMFHSDFIHVWLPCFKGRQSHSSYAQLLLNNYPKRVAARYHAFRNKEQCGWSRGISVKTHCLIPENTSRLLSRKT